MRWILSLLGLAALGLGYWIWMVGGLDQLAAWAAAEQRSFQNRMAGVLRALRSGQDGAFWGLVAVCFAYGFFHAVGPGHGKVLVGGYGLGRRVPVSRLTLIGLLASLGQAVTAILLVYSGVLILNLTRERMVGMTEQVMAPVSYGAIALIGLWLVWRGGRRLWRTIRVSGHPGQAEPHAGCSHRHGPTAAELETAVTPREMAALVGSIAIRPCTGALFVLILTWQMGIAAAGIAGAFAMALGTAVVTIAVGLGAAGLRGSLAGSAVPFRSAAYVLPIVESAAGLLVLTVATGMLLRVL